jgi:divinyl protochlorophyllide a 8-vinyl-reductase
VAVSEVHLSAADSVHRIGPNAVTRVAEALATTDGEEMVVRLFELAGLAAYLEQPPTGMVDEREVTRLHQILRAELGVEDALNVARRAGVLTGDYLLAHRIPKGVQRLLAILPARLAARVLLSAIDRHSWTFSGSGVLGLELSYPPRLSIAGCCICRGAHSGTPLCDYYASSLQHLFRALVHRDAVVTETQCQAAGAHACTFEISW